MFSSTKMPYTVRYLCLILVLLDKMDALTCGYENINYTKIEAEGSFANISQTINVTDTLDATILFEMCRNNLIRSDCIFVWKSQSREMTVRNKDAGDIMQCFWKSRSRSQSTFTFELHASYLVERSLSMIKLTRSSELLQIMRLVVTYPPEVRNMTVDGKEVSGTHLINEGEEVKVACSFDKGNPPAAFRLMDKNGKNLASGQGRLTYSLSAQCEDDWPRVYCEGTGSKLNRSVSFLIRCPLHFVDRFKVVSPSASGIITIRVKAHTTEVKECHLTPISADGNNTRSVRCTLSGSPPDLVLSLYIGEEKLIKKGAWMVTVRNKEGSTNTTYIVDTKTIFTCNWDEKKETYDCAELEPGITWYHTDLSQAILTLPENFDQVAEYFIYEISCYGHRQESTCSWIPVDERTANYTMQVGAVSSTTTAIHHLVQQDFHQFEIMALAAGNITAAILLILTLIMAGTSILLYRRNKHLKGVIRTKDNKLQQIAMSEEKNPRVESETKDKFATLFHPTDEVIPMAKSVYWKSADYPLIDEVIKEEKIPVKEYNKCRSATDLNLPWVSDGEP